MDGIIGQTQNHDMYMQDGGRQEEKGGCSCKASPHKMLRQPDRAIGSGWRTAQSVFYVCLPLIALGTSPLIRFHAKVASSNKRVELSLRNL